MYGMGISCELSKKSVIFVVVQNEKKIYKWDFNSIPLSEQELIT